MLAVAIALALLAGASGCGERSEPTGLQAELFPITVVGGGDRPVTLPAPARRIALLDTTLEGTLAAIGAARRIVGSPVDASGGLLPGDLRRLEPDLVVAPATTDERTLSRAAAATSAPIYLAPGSTIREVEQTITQLGALTAQPARARAVVRGIERRRRQVERRLRGRPRVTAFVDLGLFTTASDQTLVGDLLRAAGARNVAADIADGGPIDLAELRRADPDVYVATRESGTTLRELRADERTRKLRAVRQGRFVLVPAADLDPGPGIGRGLARLARGLHPDAFR